MKSSALYLFAADIVLLLHALIVAFVVIGLVLVFVGKVQQWSWVRNPWFRLMHLLIIAVVIIQAWFDAICPLTTIEMALRSRGGGVPYEGTFISHWLEALLYYEAPSWVFAIIYSVFGVMVIASWFWVRPRSFTKHTKHPDL